MRLGPGLGVRGPVCLETTKAAFVGPKIPSIKTIAYFSIEG